MNIVFYACILLLGSHALGIENTQIQVTQDLLGSQFKAAQDTIIQLTVANQFDMHGSSTDCGYHSFFNGLTIAKLIQTASPDQRQLYLRWLSSQEKKTELFGTLDTPWKQVILAARANEQAKKEITYRLLQSLHGAQEHQKEPVKEELQNVYTCNDGKAWISYRGSSREETTKVDKIVNIMRNSVSLLAEEIQAQGEGDFFSYTLTPEVVEKVLRPRIQAAIASNENDPKVQEIYLALDAEGIEKYFNINNKAFNVPCDRDRGSWLTADQIQLLLNEATTKEIFDPELKNCPVFILGASLGAHENMEKDPAVEDNSEFEKIKEALRHEATNQVAVILIYEPKSSGASTESSSWLNKLTSLFSWASPTAASPQSTAEIYAAGAKAASNGHWFTLVVNKMGKDLQFILADSGGNRLRITDDRAKEVIDILLREEPKDLSLPEINSDSSESENLPKMTDDKVAQTETLHKATSDTKPKTTIQSSFPIKILAIIGIVIIILILMERKKQADKRKIDDAKKGTSPTVKANPATATNSNKKP